MEQINTGAIPSPHDYRDALASAIVPTSGIELPRSLLTEIGPVLMQGIQPSCVSHSIVYLMRLYFYKKTGKWIDFSPRFLHILSAFPGSTPHDGRYPRTVLKIAKDIGCCTTATLPNDVSLDPSAYSDPNVITQAMRDEAAQYKIPGFIAVALDIQSTRENIFLFGAISTLFTVGAELYTAADGTVTWEDSKIDPLRTPNPSTSGHQMSPIGWSDGILNILQNEWSARWANGGKAKYNPHDWAPFIHEQWAIAEIPADIKDFLKSLPSASDLHYSWNQNLKYGDYNDDVKFAQIALMVLGFLTNVEPQDLGHYGPRTAAAVGKYQQSRKISPAPNSIGPQTRAALNAQFA